MKVSEICPLVDVPDVNIVVNIVVIRYTVIRCTFHAGGDRGVASAESKIQRHPSQFVKKIYILF